MQSFAEIKDDYLAYANSLGIEGVAIDKLCSLLAYSAYKNQLLQSSYALEGSFSTALKLNSRIHHAANFQYSVPRGKCPVLSVKNVRALQTKTYNHLDYIMPFNGYYFYIYLSDIPGDSKSTTAGELVDGGLNLLCSSYTLKECTVDTSGDAYFVDFVEATNASQDYRLYFTDSNGNETVINSSKITEDSSKFYFRAPVEASEEYDYEYKYLVITLPDYGIRVIRHSDKDWEGSQLTLNYIPYNETTPDFTDLTSITGFTLIEDQNARTELTVIPFEPRLENLDSIYSNAVASYLQQGSVATTEDLMIELLRYEPNGFYKVYVDKNITYTSPDTYVVTTNGSYASVVYLGTTSKTYLDIQSECIDKFKKSLYVSNEIVVVPAKENNKDSTSQSAVAVNVEAFSASRVLTTDDLYNIIDSYRSRIGETLNHSQFEADIVKLGFDYVKVYNDSDGEEATFNIVCDIYEYPRISARVRS